jgi:short-subunit dehydrogenase
VNLVGAACLVTGASSGIGRATAVRLAAGGARVVLLGRDRDRLERAAAAAGRGTAIVADLGLPEDVARAAEEAGPVDVLVNNAGVGLAGPFEGAEAPGIERLVAVSLIAPMLLTRALLPGMLERRRGHVVNVASVAGHVGVAGEAIYAATKGGLIAFTESLRQELAGRPVGISLVSPGPVDTPFFANRGAPYGRRRPRPVLPSRVADAIVTAIAEERAEVFVPRWLAEPVRLRGAVPGLYRTLASRFGGA